MDDGIFLSPDAKDIDRCIVDMKRIFNLTDEGEISDYLGIKVTTQVNGRISLT